MTKLNWKGIMPPLPTPTTADGEINVPVLKKIINFVIDNGCHGVVPLGGVGEFNSISAKNRQLVVETTVEEVNGRVPVIAGVVQTSLFDAVDSAKTFKAAGADAILTLAPYYQKPTQAGVREYFKALKGMIDMPVMLYDTPDNTHLIIDPTTILGLVEDGSLDALKASNHIIDHFNHVLPLIKGRIPIFAGETPFFAVFLAMGADGGMIGNACLMPRYILKIYELASSGRLQEALAAQHKLFPLTAALAKGPYFSSFKQMMSLIGFEVGKPLLPLLPVSDENFAKVREEFEKLKADGTFKDEAFPV